MSGSFDVSVVQGTVSNSIFLATNAIPSAMGPEVDLRKLIASLTTIQTMLPDVPNRITESESHNLLTQWVWFVNCTIWRLENMLDEISYEALRFTVETQNHTTNKVRSCLNLSNKLPFRYNRARKFRDILWRLDYACELGHDYGLKEADQTIIDDISEPSAFRPTIPLFVDDSEVVGRQDDVNAVVEMLLGPDIQDAPSVIAIVGKAGLGKTTLAQLVYKHVKVVNNFGNERMWVSGFSDFNVERILNEMVTSLTGVKSESPNIQGVVRKLREKLNGKRYLLVLDDVWSRSIGKWECMRNSLLEIGGSNGSKIIVTTRSMDVVSAMVNFPIISRQLSEIPPADSWALFKKGVFANGGPMETQLLVNIGERIVEKCHGVPFTIKSIASLLYSRHTEDEWQSIEEDSDIWSSLENGWSSIESFGASIYSLKKCIDSYKAREHFVNGNGILKNLSLTFNRLPYHLKLCFAYCFIFPKGADIKKDELIQLWMAQGYLRPTEGTSLDMEDVGHDYFDILLRSSLFQDVEMDE